MMYSQNFRKTNLTINASSCVIYWAVLEKRLFTPSGQATTTTLVMSFFALCRQDIFESRIINQYILISRKAAAQLSGYRSNSRLLILPLRQLRWYKFRRRTTKTGCIQTEPFAVFFVNFERERTKFTSRRFF